MCQLSPPLSSTSGSSCQSKSSSEIKEFFYDDDLIESADWTLGRHVSLDDDAQAHASREHSADNTLTTGMYQCKNLTV